MRSPVWNTAAGQLLGAHLHPIEQGSVLDSDNGLVGEGLHQFDLPFGKRARRGSRQHHGPDRLSFEHQGHRKDSAKAGELLPGTAGVFRVDQDIGCMRDFAVEYRPAGHGAPVRRRGKRFPDLNFSGCGPK